ARKRPVDVVLMSVGGNDVGFGGLVAYSMTDSAADFAPVAGLVGSSLRFGPQVSRAYLEVLDERMKAVKDALHDGFGVAPARVVQSSYEPIQFDENGHLRRRSDARPRRACQFEAEQAAPAGNRQLP